MAEISPEKSKLKPSLLCFPVYAYIDIAIAIAMTNFREPTPLYEYVLPSLPANSLSLPLPRPLIFLLNKKARLNVLK